MRKLTTIFLIVFFANICIMHSANMAPAENELQTKLYKTWTLAGETTAWMKIDKDNIYYVDEDPVNVVHYTMVNNELTMHFGMESVKSTISFSGDTLLMKDEGGVAKYVPMK